MAGRNMISRQTVMHTNLQQENTTQPDINRSDNLPTNMLAAQQESLLEQRRQPMKQTVPFKDKKTWFIRGQMMSNNKNTKN